MQLLSRFYELSNKQRIMVIAIVFMIGLLMVLAFIPRGVNIDRLPEESSEMNYDTSANIHEGLDLLKVIGASRFNQFSRDLFVFAKDNYKQYQSDKVVGFMLISPIKQSGEFVSFKGRYGSVSNKIDISLELKNNDRLRTSITDTKNKTNIDDKLPSNTRLNQYVATLPINEGDYLVQYKPVDDIIEITLFLREPLLANEVVLRIKESVGDELTDDKYRITFPTPLFMDDQESDASQPPPTIQNENGQTIYIESS